MQIASASGLHIKISGCFNSCGQHHVADLGFYGVSRNINGYARAALPGGLGGQWTKNAGAYGLAMGAIPSKRVPECRPVRSSRCTRAKAGERELCGFREPHRQEEPAGHGGTIPEVPTYEQDPSFYSDWGDPREYTIGDMGVGECAGEVISIAQFGLAASEREIFEAQIFLDDGNVETAGQRAYSAMLTAARALVQERNPNVGKDAEEIVGEFRKHLYDTQVFWDPYAGGKFSQYLFRIHEEKGVANDTETAHQMIEEAQFSLTRRTSATASTVRVSRRPPWHQMPRAPYAGPLEMTWTHTSCKQRFFWTAEKRPRWSRWFQCSMNGSSITG